MSTKKTKQKLIDTTRDADKFLEKLPAKQFKQVFLKIWSLRNDTRPNDSSKLKGSTDKYRTDIGEYRVIYSFDEDYVYVEVIGKRNDGEVYKS